MLIRLQELCKHYASLVGRHVILFHFSAKWQNFCARVLFYFILLQMSKPLNRGNGDRVDGNTLEMGVTGYAYCVTAGMWMDVCANNMVKVLTGQIIQELITFTEMEM